MAGRVLCRELVKSARTYDDVLIRHVNADSVASFRSREVQRFCRFLMPDLRLRVMGLRRTESEWALERLMKEAFPGERIEGVQQIDNGFIALRRLHERCAQIYNDGKGWNCTKPETVRLDIGNVFRHRKHGYRGVVVQWFKKSPARPESLAAEGPLERGFEQPFYRTLVDSRDRFPPEMNLCAEENLEHLVDEPIGIVHPKAEEFFSHFECGHHVLNPHMAVAFREDW